MTSPFRTDVGPARERAEELELEIARLDAEIAAAADFRSVLRRRRSPMTWLTVVLALFAMSTAAWAELRDGKGCDGTLVWEEGR